MGSNVGQHLLHVLADIVTDVDAVHALRESRDLIHIIVQQSREEERQVDHVLGERPAAALATASEILLVKIRELTISLQTLKQRYGKAGVGIGQELNALLHSFLRMNL